MKKYLPPSCKFKMVSLNNDIIKAVQSCLALCGKGNCPLNLLPHFAVSMFLQTALDIQIVEKTKEQKIPSDYF